MKLVSRILTLLVLASATVFYSSCGGGDDDPKSETDTQLEKLNGTWVIQANTDVKQDGGDPTYPYKNMELTITASAGSTTFPWKMAGRPPQSPWKDQGTFQFGDPVATKLKRDDNVTVTYSVTDTKLILSIEDFTGTGYTNSRVESVEGDWTFEFAKKP